MEHDQAEHGLVPAAAAIGIRRRDNIKATAGLVFRTYNTYHLLVAIRILGSLSHNCCQVSTVIAPQSDKML